MSIKRKIVTTAAAASIAIATPLIANWEGVRTKPYRDMVGVWTVCYGETQGVLHDKAYTIEECKAMLSDRVPDYYMGAMEAIKVEIPITMQAAVTSFTYNVGIGAFKKSTMLKKINSGDLWGACHELDKWAYAGKMWVKGLAKRREAEKRLCVAELR